MNNIGVYVIALFFTDDDDKNMRYVFSRTRVFSVLIKIIPDISADFQSCSVFVYPDDLIYFLLSGLCLTEGGAINSAGTAGKFYFRVNNLGWQRSRITSTIAGIPSFSGEPGYVLF
ncbi:hypothetical protein QRH67_002041 [Salmonella enterica]|nr:hypothetical protein [Salmonella enterica]ELR7836558.1 hypothetical protein [Salmonella enterica]